ncbi:tyrosine-type recombinase/integrase [Nonlabens marinus]|uniref:Tyrosine recombinase XerC n=1 Tax=Nonlabens marinus S1-08 TaxID=1454201 RepID=W8VVI6_9FLAO|nr:tyrosine-type recombinase/integrase [Nonlabens marinus]BAO55478.1 integrase, site-specific recombinase [Nonlabens marinus S1-08]
MHLSDFKKYLSLEKHYSAHTSDSYLRDLEQFQELLKTHEVSLDEANYSMVRQWMSELMDSGISSRSINRKMSSLKAYYKFLRAQGHTEKNIMTLHKSLKTSTKVQVPFSQKEVGELLNQPYDKTSFVAVRDRAIIELLYVTGMRRAELISLDINAVEVSQGRIKVLGKRNKERIIPLLEHTQTILLDYLSLRDELSGESNRFFITESGNSIYPSLVYRTVTSYLKQVSLKVKVSPHVLRHTFATHLLDKGADLNAVKELLGHSSLASTQVYTHTSMQALKNIHSKAHPRNK